MLRSYQYTEKPYLERPLQNNAVFQQELNMIKDFSLKHPSPEQFKTVCPMCGSVYSDPFFVKWKMSYVRCKECKTVYAITDIKDVDEYLGWNALKSFRMDQQYQKNVKISRQNSWREYVEWLEVRSFRFLRKNKGLNILDVGNKWKGFSDLIKTSNICGAYENVEPTHIKDAFCCTDGRADLIIYNDSLKTEIAPRRTINALRNILSSSGMIVIGARAGSGFDILTLKENNARIAPYEHILLPSVNGLTTFLTQNGFEILEITTPGVMDVSYVMDNLKDIEDKELFIQALLSESEGIILQEFQRFLQKSCMSSLVRVIARKREES